MKLDQAIFLADIPETQKMGLVPDGWYQSVIETADLRTTKDGSGKYISVRFSIIGPNYANRSVFVNLNIVNKSSVAEAIGREELGKIMRSCGMDTISDTDELIGAPVEIQVKSKKEPGYDDRNIVSDYRQISSKTPVDMPKLPSTNPYAQYAQEAQAPSRKKAPWERA
jgi:hypothetical protein